MTVKAILFDLDDTLLWDERSVREAFERTCQAASQHYPQLNPVELEDLVRSEARKLYESYETIAFTKMIGINPFEGLWGNFTSGQLEEFRALQKLAPAYRKDAWTNGLKAAGIEDAELGAKLAEQFPQERRQLSYVYEETFEVLKKLKESYSLLLLTNGSPDLQQEKLDGVPELVSFFDHILISGNFGRGKPDPSIFYHALGLLNIQPQEGVMVGDKLTTDIKGANSVGITSVWINRHELSRDGEIVPRYEIRHLTDLYPIIDDLNA
ncbi:HAD family hydrolase [Paenibacillus senegalensis]|uniref:HAD family hydrolase n=1 Tax=Paenibacillus senegalensis TaxID=1465766 RepID=UPI0002880CF8|nr:HAD family hydrolase [Paenibacillus senegalensis]